MGQNRNQYLYNGKWEEMKIITETIPLKNNRDTTITIRLTHHGPIITDVHNLLNKNNFERIYKIKMPFRKTFEYIYKNKTY